MFDCPVPIIKTSGPVCMIFGNIQHSFVLKASANFILKKFQQNPGFFLLSKSDDANYATVVSLNYCYCLSSHYCVAYSWPLLHDVIHETGNTQRIATPPDENRATDIGYMRKNLVTTGYAVPEICLRLDRQTDRQTESDIHCHYNTPLSYRGGVKIRSSA